MKTKLAIVSLLIIQFSSTAQLVRTVGVKGGAVAAAQSWDLASPFSLDTERRWGIDVGVFVEWLNMPVFSLSSELHYIQKGMKYSLPITTEEFPDGTGEYWIRSPRVDYLSIPLLGKARIPVEWLSPYVIAGPRVDFLLHTEGEGFEIVLDKFEKIDLGATIGVGLEVKVFDPAQLGIEFRFSPSFKDGYSSPYTKVRNSSLEFLFVAGV